MKNLNILDKNSKNFLRRPPLAAVGEKFSGRGSESWVLTGSFLGVLVIIRYPVSGYPVSGAKKAGPDTGYRNAKKAGKTGYRIPDTGCIPGIHLHKYSPEKHAYCAVQLTPCMNRMPILT